MDDQLIDQQPLTNKEKAKSAAPASSDAYLKFTLGTTLLIGVILMYGTHWTMIALANVGLPRPIVALQQLGITVLVVSLCVRILLHYDLMSNDTKSTPEITLWSVASVLILWAALQSGGGRETVNSAVCGSLLLLHFAYLSHEIRKWHSRRAS